MKRSPSLTLRITQARSARSPPDNCLNANGGRLYSDRSFPSSVLRTRLRLLANLKMSLPNSPSVSPPSTGTPSALSATRVFLRGLAIALPPILTLVILIWIVHGINSFVIQPISAAVRYGIAHAVQKDRVRPVSGLVRADGLPGLPQCERNYFVLPKARTELLETIAQADATDREKTIEEVRRRLEKDDVSFFRFGDDAVPYADYREVVERVGPFQLPKTSTGIYMDLTTTRFFPNVFNLTIVAVVISIALVYSTGRFVTHRLGAWIALRSSTFVTGLPLVGEIYSAVKHVTDFFLAAHEHKYHRVVAVEYPRPGIWSLAFVTGEAMLECSRAAGEPLVNVLIPSAPLPFAGYTMNVKKSELVNLDMTMDQAIQYVMSCGVITPTSVTPPSAALTNGLTESPALPGQNTQPAF